MRDRSVDAIDHPNRDDRRQVLFGPVGFVRFPEQAGVDPGFAQDGQGFRAAAHLDTLGGERRADRGQMAAGDLARHQQALGGVAGAIAVGLGVLDDGHHLGRVGGVVDIHMAIAIEVLDDRHPGVAGDALDEALAAARDDHVHELGHGDQFAHRGAVGGLDDLHRSRRQAGGLQPGPHAGGDRLVAVQGLLAAAQDRRVAALQAQRRGVRGDVGAGLVDDADDPQRYSHLANLDAARAALDVGHLADRVGQRGDLLQALGHGLDTRGAEREAVDQCRLQAFGASLLEVAGVGGEQDLAADTDFGGNGGEGLVLGFAGGRGDGARCLAGAVADGLHVGSDVHGFSVLRLGNPLLKHP